MEFVGQLVDITSRHHYSLSKQVNKIGLNPYLIDKHISFSDRHDF